MRKSIAFFFLVMGMVGITIPTAPGANAVANYGPTGTWRFCKSDAEVGCVEYIYFSYPDGRVAKATADNDLFNVGARLIMSCDVYSGGTNNSGQAYTDPHATQCDPSLAIGTNYGCTHYATAVISASVIWDAGNGGSVSMLMRTGAYEPVHSVGAGTTHAETIKDSNGNYAYFWQAKVETLHESLARDFSPTSVADTTTTRALFAVFPRQVFYGSMYAFSADPQIGTGDCGEVPIAGTWAASNANQFSSDIRVGKRSTIPQFVNRFDFIASGPHFKYPPTVGGSRTTLNNAYFHVYLSPTFLDSIGCTSDCSNLSSAASVTTADGQIANPTFTKYDDGYLADLGVGHFSAPNPKFAVAQVGPAIVATHEWRNQVTGLPTVNYVLGSSTATKSANANYAKSVSASRKAKIALSGLLKPKSGYTSSWKVTGGCKITGTKLIARATKGSCVATLTEKKGKKTFRVRKVLITTK